MFDTGADPSDIVEGKNLGQMKDSGEIEKIIEEVISKNPKVVEDFKQGKQQALQFLIGQVMAQSKGKANPEATKQILVKILTM